MAKALTKKILKYTAVFEPSEEGGYVVTIPALPGCVSQGETFEDAKKMIQDAISGYVSVLQSEKEEVPVETDEVLVTKISVPFATVFAS